MKIQIVDLSASLTYIVQDNKVEVALRILSYDLFLENMYFPTDRELLKGEYVHQEDNTEVMNSRQHIPKKMTTEHERKPHMMYAIDLNLLDCMYLLNKIMITKRYKVE